MLDRITVSTLVLGQNRTKLSAVVVLHKKRSFVSGPNKMSKKYDSIASMYDSINRKCQNLSSRIPDEIGISISFFLRKQDHRLCSTPKMLDRHIT